MKNAKIAIVASLVMASGVTCAQTLEEMERVQRKAVISKACEDIVKAGGRDETCQGYVKPASVPPTPAGSVLTRGASIPSTVADTIDVMSYRSVEVNGKLDEMVEVLVDGKTYRVKPGESAQGWKLVRLTEFEAEFSAGKNRSRVIGFRSPPPPKEAAQIGMQLGSTGMLGGPLPVAAAPLPSPGALNSNLGAAFGSSSLTLPR